MLRPCQYCSNWSIWGICSDCAQDIDQAARGIVTAATVVLVIGSLLAGLFSLRAWGKRRVQA